MNAPRLSDPAAPGRVSRLLKALLFPAVLALTGMAITVAGLLLIALNDDAVGFRNAAVPTIALAVPDPDRTGAIDAEPLRLRPGFDLR